MVFLEVFVPLVPLPATSIIKSFSCNLPIAFQLGFEHIQLITFSKFMLYFVPEINLHICTFLYSLRGIFSQPVLGPVLDLRLGLPIQDHLFKYKCIFCTSIIRCTSIIININMPVIAKFSKSISYSITHICIEHAYCCNFM